MIDVPEDKDGFKRLITETVEVARSAGARSEQAERALNALKTAFDEERQARTKRDLERASNVPDDEVSRSYVYDAGEIARAAGSVPRGAVIEAEGKALVLRGYRDADLGWVDGLLDGGESRGDWHDELRWAVTERNIIRAHQVDKGTPAYDRRIARILRQAPGDVRRFFGNDSGAGASNGSQVIFDTDLPMLEKRLDLERGVMSIFPQQPVNTPEGRFPFLTRRPRPFIHAAPVEGDPPRITASGIGLEDRAWAVKGMAIRLQADRYALEDAFQGFVSELIDSVTQALLYGEEDVGMNGHTAGTQDALATWDARGMWGSSSAGSLDHRRHSDGLRRAAAEASCRTDGGAVSAHLAALRDARATLDSAYGARNVVHICSPEYWLAALTQDDDFKKLLDFGLNQALVSGVIGGPLPNQVAVVDQAPVVLSWMLTADLADTGYYTGSGTRTTALTVRADRFRRYTLRSSRFEIQDDITNNTREHVLSSRWQFKDIDAAAVKNAHALYDLPST